MRKADVVVYDRLAHPALLKLAPPEAEKIYVGKAADRHAKTQDEINQILIDQALAGNNVVRLKGGDPFVFGRGGEEAEILVDHDIRFRVVPGVTSAIAAGAYAGIPVTHRDLASSFAVITGHERADGRESTRREPGEAEQRRDWTKIAFAADTLIFLMGVESLPEITGKLIEHGKDPLTPVALVRWATWAGQQETITGNLADIAEIARRQGFKAPAVTIVGDVVKLRNRLSWWDNRPLSGKRIVVTRAREQASALVDVLQYEGAEPIEFPVIQIAPPPDHYEALDAAIRDIDTYSWVLFTSGNGVEHFFERLLHIGFDARALGGVRIGAVGTATADALLGHGIAADFVPTVFAGEDVGRQLPGSVEGLRILIARALDANEDLPAILTKAGAHVDDVGAYQTLIDGSGADEIAERIAAGTVDVVTFTSSSTVKNFITALGPTPPAMTGVRLACIGPSTAVAVRELFQRSSDILADEYTIAGLVEALREYYL